MKHYLWTTIVTCTLLLSGCINFFPPDQDPNTLPVTTRPVPAHFDKLTAEDMEQLTSCGFKHYLFDGKTPAIAELIYTNHRNISSLEPVTMFDHLDKTKDPHRRLFYLKTITKIFDSYFSDQLSERAADFVEANTIEFLEAFDQSACFTETDLQAWADNVSLHLKHTKPDQHAEGFAQEFIRKLETKITGCTPSQAETFKQFCEMISANWENYMQYVS